MSSPSEIWLEPEDHEMDPDMGRSWCVHPLDCDECGAESVRYVRADIAEAPDVQGEPVGEVRIELGTPSVVYGELYSEAAPHLVPGTLLYAAPQPAPDVAGLVEALERLVGDVERATHVEFGGTPWLKEKMAEIDYARAALAAHRKQGDSND